MVNVNSHLSAPSPGVQPDAVDFTPLAAEALRRCDLLAQCSEEQGRITRRFLTPPMRDVHAQVGGWMRELGMAVRVDDAGNLIGRRATPKGGKTLIIGSHLDTVPGAGRYDGVLGVILGLAVVEALRSVPLPFNIDVIGFSEEEGVRFGEPYLGSSAVAGCFAEDWLDRPDANGVTVREAIATFGGNPDRLHECCYSADQVLGFIEPHLEQGPVLESLQQPVGVVTAISGQSRLAVQFLGAEGHAGTTPMIGRRDALVAAAEFIGLVRQTALQHDDLRATVGKMDVAPGAANVIPGSAVLTLDVRHPHDEVRRNAVDTMLQGAQAIAQREGCRFAVVRSCDQPSAPVDPQLTEHLEAAAAESTGHTHRLPSGAGHDAVVMAQRYPMAMLFLRHPGGISHSPEERVEMADVAVGIRVLTRAIERLASAAPHRTTYQDAK